MADTETLIGATNRKREPQGPHQRKKSFAAHLCRYQTVRWYTVLFGELLLSVAIQGSQIRKPESIGDPMPCPTSDRTDHCLFVQSSIGGTVLLNSQIS